MNYNSDEPMEKRVHQTACERCRKRKIKCDRVRSCIHCQKAKVICIFPGLGEKQRPVSRCYVQALEGKITFLELFITKLVSVDAPERDGLLAGFKARSGHLRTQERPTSNDKETSDDRVHSVTIRARVEHFRKIRDGKAAEFFGPTSPTSFFNLNPSMEKEDVLGVVTTFATTSLEVENNFNSSLHTYDIPLNDGYDFCDVSFKSDQTSKHQSEQTLVKDQYCSAFAPQSDTCRHLIAIFFQTQYQYHMCLYREYFMRDYDIGHGPYYSDLLLYSICSMGALASEDSAVHELSDVFLNRALELLYGFALDSPNLTTLQALILISHREIGIGRTSRGWMFSGMSFRLAQEMGLHLDPNNWKDFSADSRIEREILRRTYWAAFTADKQLSLYFGRPPALYPAESDVKDTERIPYPAEWKSLLNTYIMNGTNETNYEDGLCLVAAFAQKAELCKILHRMITEVFGNRLDDTFSTASAKEIHVSLTKWLTDLPAKLHWNQWSVGIIPSIVLELHLLYHSSMIILHRPARQSFNDANISTTKGVEVCYESLDTIIKLLRIFSRQYTFRSLPFTFVHILATAASVILMKQHVGELPSNESPPSRSLDIILEALDGVSQTWPSAKQVRETIVSAFKPQGMVRDISPTSFAFTEVETGDYHDINMNMNMMWDGGENGLKGFELPNFFGTSFQWDNDTLFQDFGVHG